MVLSSDALASTRRNTTTHHPQFTLEEHAQQLGHRLQTRDPLLSHLQINGYHYFYADLISTSSTSKDKNKNNTEEHYLASSTIAQLLHDAVATPHLQSLELRFIDFDAEISDAFQSLLMTKTNSKQSTPNDDMDDDDEGIGRIWKSITLTACSGLNQEDFSALALVLMKNQCLELNWQHNYYHESGSSSSSEGGGLLLSLGVAMSLSQSLQTMQMTRQDLRREQDVMALLGRGLGPATTKMVFNFCKFDKVDVLAEAIAQNTSLEELDLGACYLQDDQMEPIVNAMVGHPSLKILILTLNSCKRKTSEAMATVLQHSRCRLESIDLGHQTPYHYQAPNPSRISTTSIATATTTSMAATNLDMHSIAKALVTNRSLVQLKLRRNKLQSQDVIPLFAALETNTTLKRLDLSGNEIRDDCIPTFLAVSLRKAKGLVKLYLKDNEVSSTASAEALLKTLKDYNHVLTGLDLPRSFPLLSELQYQLALNAAGRRLLTSRSKIPLGLWPVVLEKTTTATAMASTSVIHPLSASTSSSISSSSSSTSTTTSSTTAETNNRAIPQFQNHPRSEKHGGPVSLYSQDSLYFLLSNATDILQKQ